MRSKHGNTYGADAIAVLSIVVGDLMFEFGLRTFELRDEIERWLSWVKRSVYFDTLLDDFLQFVGNLIDGVVQFIHGRLFFHR